MNDYHMHSYLCRHGEGEIFEYVESAIEKGLNEIGFAEHMPVPGLDDPTGRMLIDEWDIYLRDITDAQSKYPEIKIRLGVEAEYFPKYMQHVENFISDYPFDFVIGSVHFVDDWDFSNPAHWNRLDEFGAEYLHTRYYELITAAAKTGLYDIIGHLDLPKRLAPVALSEVTDKIDVALEAIQENNLVLDVNTAGLRKGPKEIYPSREILTRAFALQIPLIMGSDAHKPNEIAAGFDVTTDLLREIGFDRLCAFEKRQRKIIEL
jgi:histidinol-phosphatase (PHP family)